MSPETAITYLNTAKGVTYTLGEALSGHENEGAWRVNAPDGTAVLKISRNPMWRAQIERAKAATDHLRPLGYPVPTYLYCDANESGTFWLESQMPGINVSTMGPPTNGQVAEMLRLIDLQKGQNISEVHGQDWSWYAQSAVFRGESGLVRALLQYSPATSALASDIEGLVRGMETVQLGNWDLVHGDFKISQILATGDNVTAVLDWDQAGYGDRTLDLAGLWLSLMGTSEAREPIMRHMLEIASPEIIKVCAAFKMLDQLAWHINNVGGDVSAVVLQTLQAVDLLRRI